MNRVPAEPPNESSSAASDEGLILAAKQDAAKFEALYNKYYELILRFVYQRVTTKEEAFDITQQVFLQAMLKLNSYEWQGHPFSSWLYRIALNELNQLFRKEKTQRSVYAKVEAVKALKAETEGLEVNNYEQLMQNITALAVEDWELIEMRFFEERPFKEIGEILGITENNAKVKLYRALDKLKQCMTTKH